LKPTFGHGLFIVCSDGTINQHVTFEYIDEELEYLNIVSDKEKLMNELEKLRKNMQSFLDEEIVKINGRRVYPKIRHVDIGFNGSFERPYVEFFIVFKGKFKKGLNIYEDMYEKEETTYDYVVRWVFPENTKIVDVDVGFEYEVVDNRILIFRVFTGSVTPGYEKISFYLS